MEAKDCGFIAWVDVMYNNSSPKMVEISGVGHYKILTLHTK